MALFSEEVKAQFIWWEECNQMWWGHLAINSQPVSSDPGINCSKDFLSLIQCNGGAAGTGAASQPTSGVTADRIEHDLEDQGDTEGHSGATGLEYDAVHPVLPMKILLWTL
ncbi:hypothetical protein HYDPIDRAFT_169926 [Hydnomerulius pinastri MD-312]|uniref:Uncharacterized protein n=1 Tax=Hydnomerulius pinastri MD-312 TaxID=994086 RepID=A0A0C9W3X7_9AGAM|nr:hypothetical protein HYDPIDRAFT_169926 [Hydnomerulius pinastri MD-312]